MYSAHVIGLIKQICPAYNENLEMKLSKWNTKFL